AGLIFLEDETDQVRRRRIIGEVDDGHLHPGVGLGRGQRVIAQEEADRDHHVVLLVHEGLDVLLVVGWLVRLDKVSLYAQAGIGLGVLDALPGVGVEGLVGELANVGDQPNLERLTAGCRRARSPAPTAGGQQEYRNDAQTYEPKTRVPHTSSPFTGDQRQPAGIVHAVPPRTRARLYHLLP